MAKISSQQISELLLQAEQRLEGAPASKVPTRHVAVDEVQAVPLVTAAVPGGKEGSVRIAQHYNANSTKVKDSAGSDWFDLPRTVLTPEFKRDWQVLRMRGLLDPKHQKKALRAEAPKYSQVGQIIEGPTDFFSARLTRKERQRTIFDEVMKDHARDKLKSKYSAIQKKQMSGKKAFYQKLVTQRRKGRG